MSFYVIHHGNNTKKEQKGFKNTIKDLSITNVIFLCKLAWTL